MALVLFMRPQALGIEAQSALARLVPRFGPRLAPAVAIGAERAGEGL
jgi:hypothetical protein